MDRRLLIWCCAMGGVSGEAGPRLLRASLCAYV